MNFSCWRSNSGEMEIVTSGGDPFVFVPGITHRGNIQIKRKLKQKRKQKRNGGSELRGARRNEKNKTNGNGNGNFDRYILKSLVKMYIPVANIPV